MLRFTYALMPGEELDPASLRVEEFDRFEAADKADHGVAVAGRRCGDLAGAFSALSTGAQWAVFQPQLSWKEVARQINQSDVGGLLLIEPWTDCPSVRELWQFSEAITRPNVKLAWSASWGDRTGQTPASVIPVLNLRIGLVRVTDASNTTIELAKRLAGIGFDGSFVVNPPEGEDRLGEARKIAEIVRDVIEPRKPVKSAHPKAAVTKK